MSGTGVKYFWYTVKLFHQKVASKFTFCKTRLGVKKFGGEFVIPGNIIIRQRGKKYHNGENVGLGKDYTIYAKATGWVHFTFDNKRKRNFVHVLNKNPHFANMQKMAALARDPEQSLENAKSVAYC